MAESVLSGETVVPARPFSAVEDRTPVYIAYACLGFGLLCPFFVSLIGVIIAYLKRSESGAVLRAHYAWIIDTFWVTLVVGIVGGLLTLVVIGWLILAVLWIWYIYRVVRGVVRLSEGRAPKG